MPNILTLLIFFVLTAALSVVAGAASLPALRRLGRGQHTREDVPETHSGKAGTPSMGGIGILAAVLVAGLLFTLITGNLNLRVFACMSLVVGYAVVGLIDDWRKLGDKKSKGILARYRIAAEVILAGVFVVLARGAPVDGSWLGSVGWAIPLAAGFRALVVVGAANAVNLTDGLDGLAAGLTSIAGLAMTCVCATLGLAEMAVWSMVIAGAAAGFLVLNAKPAMVWMGDVGSLGLGAALASVAVAAKVEFLFAIIGVVFVAEALSVILQVISFQSTGKRIFRMAPIHHHFELIGWDEQKVVSRFWLAGAIAAVFGLLLFHATV